MKDLTPYLEKYAKLAVEVGINLKEKEGLIITTSTDGLPLSRLIAKEAYLSGAKHVELVLNDDEFALMRYQYGKIMSLRSTLPGRSQTQKTSMKTTIITSL